MIRILLIIIEIVAWFYGFLDFRNWKRVGFQTDIQGNEGDFFSFLVIFHVVAVFVIAIKLFFWR